MHSDEESSDSDSSIDAAVEGTMDQRVDGPPDCYCSNPSFVREVQKKLLRKELSCSICLQMLVKPVTLQCGHTFCRHCLLTYILKKSHLGCGICRFENVLQHPLDIRVNVLLDGVARQLNPRVYMRNLKLQQEEERKNRIREKLLELFPYDINFAQKQIEHRVLQHQLVQERYMTKFQWIIYKILRICEVIRPYVRIMRVLVTFVAPIILFFMYVLHKSYRTK